MSNVQVINNLGRFGRNAIGELDNAIREGATNILIASKNKAPFDKGGLRADTEVKKVQNMHWRVSYWKEYARFQEFGGDAYRTVRNYTTAGTGKKYLSTAGDNESELLMARIKVYAKRART